MRTLSIISAFFIVSSAAFDAKVAVERDGTSVQNEWEVTCGSLGDASTATFTVKVDTAAGFSTYNVELMSQWTSSSLVSSEEEGEFRVKVGKSNVYRGLPVGEEHELTVSNVYDTAGDHQTEFVAIIKTGAWDWPDGHEFSSGDHTLSVSRGSCTYRGNSGGSTSSGSLTEDESKAEESGTVASSSFLAIALVASLVGLLS